MTRTLAFGLFSSRIWPSYVTSQGLSDLSTVACLSVCLSVCRLSTALLPNSACLTWVGFCWQLAASFLCNPWQSTDRLRVAKGRGPE